jgi:hydroxyethylthiazole kinase-like uncharacterized protein yjeF
MRLPILQSDSLRAIEAEHADAAPPLMERAGACAARIAAEMLAGRQGRPLVAAGPGNNGGDAFVVARLLKEAGHEPLVLFEGDPSRLPKDARQAHAAWLNAGGATTHRYPSAIISLAVDGLFGIGLTRPIEGNYADWIARMNASGCPILALDVPSGLNAITGATTGPHVRATQTATFIALKPGLLTADGPDCCGTVSVCDLGLAIRQGDGERIVPELFAHCLQPRTRNSHKGSYGSVAIVGGAPGMAGAALLAGRAALGLGAGRVYLGTLERLAVDAGQPELMLRSPAEAMAAASVLAVGPGLGQSPEAGELLAQALACAMPLVVDADALTLLARDPTLLAKRAVPPAPTFSGIVPPASTILTPHPAEAARLLGCSTADVQADRVAAAQKLAQDLGGYVALKGCGTVVATPDGRWFINATGNPGLASAGSGDVLTGLLAALLAQHWPPLEALLGAVHLHGAAADACVAAGNGPIGLTAGALIPSARKLLNRWIANLER